MKEEISWFVNYTNIPNSGRTTETKFFNKLKDAKEFIKENSIYGYLIRFTDGGNKIQTKDSKTSLIKYFNGFEPSATEGIKIKSLINV